MSMRPKVAPKYLTLAEAADYCGYGRKKFKVIVTDFAIPVYGPDRDRYRPEDLDLFMEEPETFRVIGQIQRKRTFTPVRA